MRLPASPSITQPIQFRDLETVVDDLHDLFLEWSQRQAFVPPLDAFTLEVLKFAVHEWVANLVQHAHFGARSPLVEISIRPREEYVHCVIEDNSHGFDFDCQVEKQREAVEAPAPPERGRGLLMMIACTENLRYVADVDASDEARNRLEFSISAAERPWIDIPF